MNEEYYAGMDCNCYAYSQNECACEADWTDPEVYKLEAEVNILRDRVAELEHMIVDTYDEYNSTGHLSTKSCLKSAILLDKVYTNA